MGTCVWGLQVPMVGKGAVEALVATLALAAVQGGGARSLPVQKAACSTLWSLSDADGVEVRLYGSGATRLRMNSL